MAANPQRQSRARTELGALLQLADIRINGDRPWDLRVMDERAYELILQQATLGLGEAYMDGWVDCEQWDVFVDKALRSPIVEHLKKNWRTALHGLEGTLLNLGSKSRAFIVGEKHYDIGNDLYSRMLDPRLAYTCGYWRQATTLAEAQEAKLDLVCKKIGLKPGMRVLDIGCGWGSFVKFAAERYGAQAVGITVSREQAKFAQDSCKGLPVQIVLQDYRDLRDRFDRVISLGMFEHVSWKNYRDYMKVAHRALADDGMFLLHTIGGNVSTHSFDPWLGKYIFPNAMLPSIAQIGAAIEGLFVMEDWHNFGADYDRTLMAWHTNFEGHWQEIAAHYDDRFRRMWKFYLLTCAGTFRARKNQLWQIVLSKNGVAGGYQSIR